MSHYSIYHNPRCSKSRQALQILQDQGIDADIIRYMEQPMQRKDLDELLLKLDTNAAGLVRKGESAYKDLGLDGANISEHQMREAMLAEPRLIERPILVRDNRAVIGRPPERILELID